MKKYLGIGSSRLLTPLFELNSKDICVYNSLQSCKHISNYTSDNKIILENIKASSMDHFAIILEKQNYTFFFQEWTYLEQMIKNIIGGTKT